MKLFLTTSVFLGSVNLFGSLSPEAISCRTEAVKKVPDCQIVEWFEVEGSHPLWNHCTPETEVNGKTIAGKCTSIRDIKKVAKERYDKIRTAKPENRHKTDTNSSH